MSSLLIIGGSYAGSALACGLVWFLVLFIIFTALQNSVDNSQPAGATALGSFLFAAMIAIVLGLFGIVIPGIPVLLFFAFRGNSKRAKEEVTREFYRPYWEARTRQMQALAASQPHSGSVPSAAIAAAELEQFLVTDAEATSAL